MVRKVPFGTGDTAIGQNQKFAPFSIVPWRILALVEWLSGIPYMRYKYTDIKGVILPKCGNSVYVIDVGISRVYGGYSAALEIMGDVVTAIYPKGRFTMFNIEQFSSHHNIALI